MSGPARIRRGPKPWPQPFDLGPELIARHVAEARRLRTQAINAAIHRLRMRMATAVRSVRRGRN